MGPPLAMRGHSVGKGSSGRHKRVEPSGYKQGSFIGPKWPFVYGKDFCEFEYALCWLVILFCRPYGLKRPSLDPRRLSLEPCWSEKLSFGLKKIIYRRASALSQHASPTLKAPIVGLRGHFVAVKGLSFCPYEPSTSLKCPLWLEKNLIWL